jgi:hypothetical protein
MINYLGATVKLTEPESFASYFSSNLVSIAGLRTGWAALVFGFFRFSFVIEVGVEF